MSEKQHTFESGAKRSEVKPLYSTIPYVSLRRVALRSTGAPDGEIRKDTETGFRYEGGAAKYGYDNWRRGLPMRDTFNHVIEHLYRWKEEVEQGRVPDDDDLAAAAWGILLPLMTFEREYLRRVKDGQEP